MNTTIDYFSKASAAFTELAGTENAPFVKAGTNSNFWHQGCSFDTLLDYLLLALEKDTLPDDTVLDSFFTAAHEGFLSGVINSSTIQYDDFLWYALASAKAFDPAYQPVFRTAARLKIFQNMALDLWGIISSGRYSELANSTTTKMDTAWGNPLYSTVKVTKEYFVSRGEYHLGTPNTFNGYYKSQIAPYPKPKPLTDPADSWPDPNNYYLKQASWAKPRFTGGAWQYDFFTPDQITWIKSKNKKFKGLTPTYEYYHRPDIASDWMATCQISLMTGMYMGLSSQLQKARSYMQQSPPGEIIETKPTLGSVYIDTDTYNFLHNNFGETKSPYKTAADNMFKFAMKDWLNISTDETSLFNLFGKTVTEVKNGKTPVLIRERVPTLAPMPSSTTPVPSPSFKKDRYWTGDQGVLIGGLMDYAQIAATPDDKTDAINMAISLTKGVATHLIVPGGNEKNSNALLPQLPVFYFDETIWKSPPHWWAKSWQFDNDDVMSDKGDYSAGTAIFWRGVLRGCLLDPINFLPDAKTALAKSASIGEDSVVAATSGVNGNVYSDKFGPGSIFKPMNNLGTNLAGYYMAKKS